MKRIYLGYSLKTFDKVHRALDIDGEFMEVLAQDYLDAGAFEIYPKEDYPEFYSSYDEMASHFPFSVNMEVLKRVDLNKVSCIFWVYFENDLYKTRGKVLNIVGDFYIEKFAWED